MKPKAIFSRHRRDIYIILATLVLVCLAFIVRQYRQRAANRIQVYDLTWPDETDKNNIVYRRWRYFIEPRTCLPVRIEKYSKRDPNDNYTLLETLVITYPSDEEILQVIRKYGFVGPLFHPDAK